MTALAFDWTLAAVATVVIVSLTVTAAVALFGMAKLAVTIITWMGWDT